MERTRINERSSINNENNKLTIDSEFGMKKTIIILAIVAGCFAVLWPKIFYPMLIGPTTHTTTDGTAPIRQERKVPIHSGILHPAMREKGRAIPASHIVPRVDGRPDHIVPKMRPPMGGAGRVMPPQGGSAGGGSSMGIIMPLYTVGILLFFLYTMAKILRKNSKNEIHQDYRNIQAEREFRDRVFNPATLAEAITGTNYSKKEKSKTPDKTVPTIEELKAQAAGDIEVDMLLRRLADTEAAMERIVVQMGNFSRTIAPNSENSDTQVECMDKNCCLINRNEIDKKIKSPAAVKVLEMETTAITESGRKINIFTSPSKLDEHQTSPTTEVYIKGIVPQKCNSFMVNSETEEEKNDDDSQEAVILSSKVTISLITHDNELYAHDDSKKNVYEKNRNNKKENFENEKIEIIERSEEEEEEEEDDEDDEFITAKQDKSRDEIEDDEDAELKTENNQFTISDYLHDKDNKIKKIVNDEESDIDSDEISNEIEDDDDKLENDNLIIELKKKNKEEEEISLNN